MTGKISLNWINKMLDKILELVFLIVFVFLITPLGLILRLIGVDYLNRKIEKQNKSYWIKR